MASSWRALLLQGLTRPITGPYEDAALFQPHRESFVHTHHLNGVSTMQRFDRTRRPLGKLAASFATALFILTVAAQIASATLITRAGTVASSIGNGFAAYTETSRAANLAIESDAYHGSGTYYDSTSANNTT